MIQACNNMQYLCIYLHLFSPDTLPDNIRIIHDISLFIRNMLSLICPVIDLTIYS